MADFRGKVVLITGASSGIGAATAEAFAKLGAWLSLTGRNVERLNETGEKCQQLGANKDKILFSTCDLVEPSSVDLIVKNTVDKFGRIDVLVNNAGYGLPTPIETMTIEQVDHMYKVLLRAPLFLSQKALPYLKETKGCIVNVSSHFSMMVVDGSISYCAMKAALDQVTKSLALAAGPYGVRVNSINTGIVKTPIHIQYGIPADCLDAHYEQMARKYPIRHVAEPAEIASSIVFLASSTAASLTGATLIQDGGSILQTIYGNVSETSS